MSKFYLFHLDLISKEKFSLEEIESIKESLKGDETSEIIEICKDVICQTKDGRIEIYAEDTGITCSSSEEILSFVKVLESKVNGFISGSSFEVGKEEPGFSESWIKGEFSWESEIREEQESWEDDTFWEDDWDGWNEEWN